MVLTATTNTSANSAIRYLGQNQAMQSSSLAKLSSGSRIVKASDDAASLAVGTKIKADVTALKQASVNAGQASSLLQVADGGISKVSDILQRMKALSVQAQSGSVTDNERAFLDREYQQLSTQIDDIAGQTRFNGSALLNGSNGKTINFGTGAATDTIFNSASTHANGITANLSGNAAAGTFELSYAYTASSSLGQFSLTDGTISDTIQFTHGASDQVFEGRLDFDNAGIELNLSNFDFTTAITGGATTQLTVAGTGALTFQVGVSSGDTISLSIGDVGATALGINGTDITSSGTAVTAGGLLDTAISTVNDTRATLGAQMSRFEFVSANLATSIENLDAARSTLLDVDMAAEMTKFTSAQVLTQAGVAMLAQANQMPQNLLRLLN
ncbi:MAG: flagellin [Pseudomonadota bacterium]